MLDSFRRCFGREPARQRIDEEHLQRPSTSSAPRCIFCDVTREKGFNVVLEDANFTVFKDRSPGARLHLLCVPKVHHENIKTLTRTDVPMLHAMSDIGDRLLDHAGFGGVDRRLGFHIPPFYSVNHLHLHILGLPFASRLDRLKYRPAYTSRHDRSKGFSHFVEIDQAIAILQKGGKVGVLPC